VKKLTPIAVGAIRSGMKLNAGLCLIIRRKVHFFHKFMITMGEGAFVLKFAFSKEFPISAHFSFVLNLVLPDEIFSLLF